jgi:ABC-type uncharacterized transport system substrate-binding protein
MEMIEKIRTKAIRLLLAALLAGLSGCTLMTPAPDEPVVVVDTEPEPSVIEVAPEPEPEPDPEPEPPPAPQQEPPEAVAPRVAVVLSNRAPAFTDVADELLPFLESHDVYDLSDRSRSAKDTFDAIAGTDARAVVAIGLSAAKLASKYSAAPVVVSQVFNISVAELRVEGLKSVSVLPPIENQIEAWEEIDPTLRNVGAVLGPGHDELIAETEAALRQRGIKFHYAIANSDRETLYLFDRLVRDIDGFILFPDNRILSRNVLKEMMSTASRQRVQVAVFNESLLDAGATFCAAAVEADIAETIARLLNRIIDGQIDTLPAVSKLNNARITTSESALRTLGLQSSGPDLMNSVAEAQ